MDFQERRWLLSNPIAAVALIVAAIGVAFAVWFDDAPKWTLAVIGLVWLLVATGSMRTRVEGGAITIVYWPIWRRRVELSRIESARLIPYKWLHYGGWGIRYGQRAWAYSVWEKDAIRLQKEGTDVVIGSKRAKEFLEVLRAQGIDAVDTTDDTPL